MTGVKIDVEIKGLDKLLKDFQNKYPKDYQRVVSAAMDKAVKDVERWAKRQTPWDRGHLRASAGSEVKHSAGEIKGFMGYTVKYAPHVEEGGGKPRRGGRIPFLEPAVEEHEGEIFSTFEKAIDNLVKDLDG